MATIYTFNSDGDTVALYITLESMNSAGYFPLTVASPDTKGSFRTTLYDDLGLATEKISSLLAKHKGFTKDRLIEEMEDILVFFTVRGAEDVEVWAEGDLPYLLVNEDYED